MQRDLLPASSDTIVLIETVFEPPGEVPGKYCITERNNGITNLEKNEAKIRSETKKMIPLISI